MKKWLNTFGKIAIISTGGLLQSCISTIDKNLLPTSMVSSVSNEKTANIAIGNRGKRVALVIGNNNYIAQSKLKGAVNDASALASTFESLGFQVSLVKDAGRKEMESAVNAFEQQAKNANVVVFYYSGHGVQWNGENFLVPVDSPADKGHNYSKDSVSANFIQGKIQDATKGTKIMILDACRSNIQGSTTIGKGGTATGLAKMKKTSEFLIAYATETGNFAQDGIQGQNSPYVKGLLKYIKEPIPIEKLFKKVRTSVYQETKGKQLPDEESALMSDFCFTDCGIKIADISSACRINIGRGIYEGECQDGKANGQGVQRYADGEYYTGSFQNNLRHGSGRQYLTDGTEISGSWENGRLVSSN